MKYVVWLLCVLTVVSGCRKHEDAWTANGQTRVLTTFAPLYCFARQVAGTDATVHCLLTSQGPHDYEPTAQDALKVRDADLLIVNGLQLDDFVTRLIGNSGNKKVEVVNVGEALPADMLLKMDHDEDDRAHDAHAEEHAHHGDHDPHIWLGPPQAIKIVEQIAAKLSLIDPAHKDAYAARAKSESEDLQKLLEYGKAAFKDKKNRRLIAQHDSLGYFAKAFDLEIIGDIQPQAGIEADAKKLTELVTLCKEKNVTVLCTEPQFSTKSAETLRNTLKSQGVQIQLVEVDPIETAPGNPDPDPNYYLERMRKNIDALASAMR